MCPTTSRGVPHLLLFVILSRLLCLSSGSLAEFHQLDLSSLSFDVDWAMSADDRWTQLRNAASVPLKGWNSYDGWDWSVTELDVINNVDYVATNLSSYGYNIVTIDYYWYLDLNYSYVYLDAFGRLQPDPIRFPSSRGSLGFKALAAYAHSKGLLFGIHTMRGISPEAVLQRRPVLNTSYTADEVYDAKGACPWMLTTRPFYSLNMSHPGGQAFYNSLYAQYAEWGVDFVKNDCVYGNFVPDQIDGVSKAIENSGRRMLYSLSPGSSNNDWAKRVVQEVNMYRVTGDTWDRWGNIASHFLSAQQMAPFIGLPNGRYGLPSWPDLDMLPLGWLGIEGGVGPPVRPCNLTRDEQVTLMSLWTIFRSPLIYGGDFQHPDPFTISLLTNTEALAITDNSTNTDSVLLSNIAAVWRSDSSSWRDDGRSYFSVHNLADFTHTLNVSVVSVRGQQSGGSCVLRDVWERKDVDTGAEFAFSLNRHASGLYALHSCKADESTMTASN